jgi:hypothetical protein
VEAVDGAGMAGRSRADTTILVDERPLAVLVHEGRPSWTTTFVRRALENDDRFAVTQAARVSRGIMASASRASARTTEAGGRNRATGQITADLIASQTIVIVGAPETLTAAEVESLRAFVTRGGGLILAPDERPKGPYMRLLSDVRVDERLLDEPTIVSLAEAPELALLASELIDARTLPAGGQPIASRSRPNGASVWTAPLGRGRVLFVGALDAWRFRGRRGDAFDRFWPQIVEWLGRDLAEPLRVECEPRVAAPGERVTVRVRRRAGDEAAQSLRVAIEPASPAGGRTRDAVLRLWPDAESGVFSGVINAPEEPGVYAVSATSGPAGADDRSLPSKWTSQAPLVVDPTARRAQRADDRWRLATTTRGGVMTTPADVDRAAHAIVRTDREQAAEQRFPMRSLWWLWAFTACLGGEWQLRRRAGLR